MQESLVLMTKNTKIFLYVKNDVVPFYGQKNLNHPFFIKQCLKQIFEWFRMLVRATSTNWITMLTLGTSLRGDCERSVIHSLHIHDPNNSLILLIVPL